MTKTKEIEKKQFEAIIKNIKDVHENVTMENITEIVIIAMQTLQQYKNLSGEQKKQTVINVLNFIVDEDQTMNEFDMIIKMMIPSVIDNLISVDKGKIKFKENSCFSCLF